MRGDGIEVAGPVARVGGVATVSRRRSPPRPSPSGRRSRCRGRCRRRVEPRPRPRRAPARPVRRARRGHARPRDGGAITSSPAASGWCARRRFTGGGHLHHLHHASTSVGPSVGVDHRVDGAGDVVMHGRERPGADLLEHERRQPVERIGGRIGVHRTQRAVVAGVERLQQVDGLGATHLAHDETVGAHAQGGAKQVGERHLAHAFRGGVARLETQHVRMVQPKFGDVFQRHDPAAGVDGCGQRVQQRGLARRGGAADHDVAPPRHERANSSATAGSAKASSGMSRTGKRRMARHGPSTATGSMTAHRRGAVREPCIDGRVGAVETPSDRAEHVLDGRHERGRAHVPDPCDVAGALDPHLATGVDHDLVDRGVVQPTLEAAEGRLFGNGIDHATRCAGALSGCVRLRGRRAASSPASTLRNTCGS